MKEKVKLTSNEIELTGKVRKFTKKTFDSGTEKANISIYNDVDKNNVFVQMFGREGMKYGEEEVTLDGLKKIFMDSDGKSRMVLVHAFGSTGETVYQGKTYLNNNIFSIYPSTSEDDMFSAFRLNGFVDSVKETEDENGGIVYKIKVGTYNLREKRTVISGVSYTTVIIDGELAEEIEDLEKGCFIAVGGDIINKITADRYGGEGKSEVKFIARKAKVKVTADDNEDDYEVFKKAKKLSDGKTISTGVETEEKPAKEDLNSDDLD